MNPFKLLVGNDHIDELRSKLHDHEQCLDTTQQSLVKLFNRTDEVATLRAALHALQFRCDKLEEAVDKLDANNYELSVLMKKLQDKPKATPKRALHAAPVVADAMASYEEEIPQVAPPLKFYNDAGGFVWFKRNATGGNLKVCAIWMRDKNTNVPWCLSFGKRGIGRSKSKCFATRHEAEQFAYDVLKIHEAECIKRKSPTDWWNRVNIFEVTPNRRPA